MPKMLVEGYRPGKGDGGRWTGVIDKHAEERGDSGYQKRNAASGRFMDVKPPKGGSAIRSASKNK